jgi:hypothetical protein
LFEVKKRKPRGPAPLPSLSQSLKKLMLLFAVWVGFTVEVMPETKAALLPLLLIVVCDWPIDCRAANEEFDS